MSGTDTDRERLNDAWARFLSGQERMVHIAQRVFRPLPAPPRCVLCYAPFKGPFAGVLKLIGKDPWPRNPNICRYCGDWLRKQGPGGANVELTLLFADIRGSTRLAESLPAPDYVDLINRFYAEATAAFVRHGAIIDQLVGDEAIGLFLPGFVGQRYTSAAIAAARDLLAATGHGPDGPPWAPLGIGIHTGEAFVGSVGSEANFTDFTAVGDTVNTTARLAARADTGEILVSAEAARQASLATERMSARTLEVKGKAEPLTAFVVGLE